MRLESMKASIATLWVSSVWAAGIAGNVNSLPAWTVLASGGILLPLILLWRWEIPRPSMSESSGRYSDDRPRRSRLRP